jgi:hypothetical protein
VGRKFRGLNPSRDRGYFSPSKGPVGLWGTPSLVLNLYRGSLPGVKRAVPTNFRVVLRLRKNGATPLLPLYAFMINTGRLYFLLLLMEACTHVNADLISIQIHKCITQIQVYCIACIVTRKGLMTGQSGFHSWLGAEILMYVPCLGPI